MQSINPTQMESTDSESGSESFEWAWSFPSPAVPLLPYHKAQHQQAGPLLIQLYYATRGAMLGVDTKSTELIDAIDSINKEIMRLNGENSNEAGLGTIDTGVFLHAWSQDNWNPSLEDFCRLYHYPMQWADRPPTTGSDYHSYRCKYWEQCEWKSAEILLGSVWSLRKTKAEDEVIVGQELLLYDFEIRFNDSLNQLRTEHGDIGSRIGFLDLERIFNYYQELMGYLTDDNPEEYNNCRENLRRECALNVYPTSWVPRPYADERDFD